MSWRSRETWIVTILAGLVAFYLAAVLNEIVPILVAWYAAMALLIEVVIALSLILFATGLVWGAEPAKRSPGGYRLWRHVLYAFGSLLFAFFGSLIDRLLLER